MVILIISKDTGLGNQVQFAPVVRHLLRQGHTVTSDSDVYQTLGLPVPVDTSRPDRIYVVFGYNWLAFWKICLRYPITPKYGYKYRIRGRHIGLGYARSFRFDPMKSEVMQNVNNLGGKWL